MQNQHDTLVISNMNLVLQLSVGAITIATATIHEDKISSLATTRSPSRSPTTTNNPLNGWYYKINYVDASCSAITTVTGYPTDYCFLFGPKPTKYVCNSGIPTMNTYSDSSCLFLESSSTLSTFCSSQIQVSCTSSPLLPFNTNYAILYTYKESSCITPIAFTASRNNYCSFGVKYSYPDVLTYVTTDCLFQSSKDSYASCRSGQFMALGGSTSAILSKPTPAPTFSALTSSSSSIGPIISGIVIPIVVVCAAIGIAIHRRMTQANSQVNPAANGVGNGVSFPAGTNIISYNSAQGVTNPYGSRAVAPLPVSSYPLQSSDNNTVAPTTYVGNGGYAPITATSHYSSGSHYPNAYNSIPYGSIPSSAPIGNTNNTPYVSSGGFVLPYSNASAVSYPQPTPTIANPPQIVQGVAVIMPEATPVPSSLSSADVGSSSNMGNFQNAVSDTFILSNSNMNTR